MSYGDTKGDAFAAIPDDALVTARAGVLFGALVTADGTLEVICPGLDDQTATRTARMVGLALLDISAEHDRHDEQ